MTGEMLQGHQCQHQINQGFPVGRARHRLGTGLPEVGHGLVPLLPLKGMVGKPLDLFTQVIAIELFDRLGNTSVEAAPPLL